MTQLTVTKLENLVSEKEEKVEIPSSTISRDDILEQLNSIITCFFPGCWTKGEFINSDSGYMAYDVHLSGITKTTFSSIRFLDFGDKFLLIRV